MPECYQCGSKINMEEAYVCVDCHRYFCHDCIRTCSSCGEYICEEDVNICHSCNDYFCKDCSTYCDACEWVYCETHMPTHGCEECEICGNITTEDNLYYVESLNTTVCSRCYDEYVSDREEGIDSTQVELSW